MAETGKELVHSAPNNEGGASITKSRAWKWTKVKRKAVRMVCRGWPDTRIAKELGKHRNTIRNWKGTAEFNAAVITYAREYVNRVRFKRVHESGIIADQLASQVARQLAEVNKSDAGDVKQGNLNAMQLFLREYREFRAVERSDFGDDVRRVEGSFHVTGTGLTTGDNATGSKGAQSFKRFVEDNASTVPKRVLVGNEQQSLVGVARALMQGTDILNELHEEDVALHDAQEGSK